MERRAFWESWKTDDKLYCAYCKECNEFHRGRLPKRAGIKYLFAGTPVEVMHVNLTGPHVNSQGYRYIMTTCDSFTRFVIAVPLRSKTALSVARTLVRGVILKFGALSRFSLSSRMNSGKRYVGYWDFPLLNHCVFSINELKN